MSSVEKKILGLTDIALLTFVSNFGIRWLSVAAGMGASAPLYWVLGALIMAMPLSYITAKMSQLYPQEGGIYAWTRETLGEKTGFIVAWVYFINNIFYYPALLIFFATNVAFFIGKPALANSHYFICAVVLGGFWSIVLMSLCGLKFNKIATVYGGCIGSIMPALLLMAAGAAMLIFSKHSATPFTVHSLFSNQSVLHNLSNLTIILYAMTGFEIIPTFANAVKNPKRDLYVGVLAGMFLIVLFYIMGSIALNVIASPNEIHKTSGLMHAFYLASHALHIPWMTRPVAFILIFSEIAFMSIWLIAPVTVFFKCTPTEIIPAWFKKTNPQGAPANALFFVGILVTVILLATNLLPSVNDMYQILVLMAAVLVFIPYLVLTYAFIKNRYKMSDNTVVNTVFPLLVLFSLVLGILCSFQLPSNLHLLSEKIVYEMELILGPIFFILLGYFIYHRGDLAKNSVNEIVSN